MRRTARQHDAGGQPPSAVARAFELTGDELEDLIAPVCTRLGWKSNLAMAPLLKKVDLVPEVVMKVNMFNGWRLIGCVNRK